MMSSEFMRILPHGSGGFSPGSLPRVCGEDDLSSMGGSERTYFHRVWVQVVDDLQKTSISAVSDRVGMSWRAFNRIKECAPEQVNSMARDAWALTSSDP